MKRLLLCALLALVFVPSAVSQPRAAKLLLAAPFAAKTAVSPAPAATGTVPLAYHGGQLMRTQVVRNVYWQPVGLSYGDGYQAGLDRFVGDVAAGSGRSDNVFSVMTQYGSPAGPIAYALSFAGSFVDTTPYPRKLYNCPLTTYCVRDQDIQARLTALIIEQGWPRDFSHAYTVYMPQNVGVYRNGSYSYEGFCAYHGFKVFSASSAMIYSVLPYMNWAGKCLARSTPSNDPSLDAATTVTSHELIESFTDPTRTGWWGSSSSDEIADRCGGQYGDPLGSTEYGVYNQSINGNPYYLQGEWSNAIGACAWGG